MNNWKDTVTKEEIMECGFVFSPYIPLGVSKTVAVLWLSFRQRLSILFSGKIGITASYSGIEEPKLNECEFSAYATKMDEFGGLHNPRKKWWKR